MRKKTQEKEDDEIVNDQKYTNSIRTRTKHITGRRTVNDKD